MPITSSFTVPTGKRAFFFSLQTWLKANVPGSIGGPANFTYSFLNQLAPAVMPRVEVNEFRYFDPGESAMGGVIFPNASGAQQSRGTEMRCMIELNIYLTGKTDQAAKQDMYRIRDNLIYALRNSGVPDASGNPILPYIPMLDPANSNFDTGIVIRALTEESNCFIENYYAPDAEKPTVHRYQILAKMGWYEMRN